MLGSMFIKFEFYNTGLYTEMQVEVPSCYTGKIPFYDEGEFRSVIIWGKKQFCSLVVWHTCVLLQDGSRVKTLWQVLSFSILWALCRHLNSPISLTVCRVVQMMFWVVLNWRLQRIPVLDPAWTMLVCHVSSQDAFYCCSVEVDKTWLQNWTLLSGYFPQEVQPFFV